MTRIERAVLVCAAVMAVPVVGRAATTTTINGPTAFMTLQGSTGTRLMSLNLNTGAVVGAGKLAVDIDQLAYDPVNNMLYGAMGQNLYSLSGTGDTYFLSTVTGLGSSIFTGMAVNSAGELYTLASDGTIRTVDPISGQVTTTISSSHSFADALAFDPNDTLYAGTGGASIVTYDLSSDATASAGAQALNATLGELRSLDWFFGTKVTTVTAGSGTASGSGSGTASGSGSSTGSGSAGGGTTTVDEFSHLYGLFDLADGGQMVGEIGPLGNMVPANTFVPDVTGTLTSLAFTKRPSLLVTSGTLVEAEVGTGGGTGSSTGSGSSSGSSGPGASPDGTVVPTPSAALGGVALAGMYGGFLCIRRRSGAAARA